MFAVLINGIASRQVRGAIVYWDGDVWFLVHISAEEYADLTRGDDRVTEQPGYDVWCPRYIVEFP